MKCNSICDVPGIKVGHAHNVRAKTGCTVILPQAEATAGVDVRGSAPGSREIELLYPTRHVTKIHAILLTGGSAFGLDAAGGVQQFLEEQNIGYDTGVARVPIVPAAVIFDLAVGDPKIRPDKKMGYEAAQNASAKENSEGQTGAGIGATVGKLAGQENAMNGGIGTCSHYITEEIVVGVLVVVNALGNIIDPNNNKTIAGAQDKTNGGFFNPIELLKKLAVPGFSSFTNTTLGVVATNADLTREEVTKIAQMAQDGFARTISPSHTQYDGDIIFVLSTNATVKVNALLIGSIAAELTANAVIRATKYSNQK